MYFPSPSFCWSPFSISIIFPYLSIIFAFDSSLSFNVRFIPWIPKVSRWISRVAWFLRTWAAARPRQVPRSRDPEIRYNNCAVRLWRKMEKDYTLEEFSYIQYISLYILKSDFLINLIHILTGKISAIHQLHLRSHHFTAVHSVHRQHRHLRFQSLRTRLHHPAARPQSCTKS